MTVLAVILLVAAIGVAVVAALAWTGRLPGNSFVGIRVPEVRASRTYWVLAHRVAGPPWAGSAMFLLIAGLLAFRASGWLWLYLAIAVLVALVFLGVGATMGARTVALADAKDKAARQAATAGPSDAAVDLSALRRAARTVDEPGADRP